MSNLIEWILEETNEYEIEAVVIGELGWGDYGKENIPNYDKQPRQTILTWKEAKSWLDYEFDSGYGSPMCNAIYVWTKNKILFISQYDGATSLNSIPRNPTDEIMPTMPGGG